MITIQSSGAQRLFDYPVCVCCLFADYTSSKLFGDAPQDIMDILVSQNVTAHVHHFCVTEAVSDVTFLENKIIPYPANVENIGSF